MAKTTVKASEKARAIAVFERLDATYPEVRCTLNYKNPFQLLLMTILAAQCTDERVNIVCKDLFEHYKTPQDFVDVPLETLEVAVHACGFFRSKAKNIKATCAILVNEHGGEVPRDMESLVRLPGVGRKTANVVRGECFGEQGVIVDTHCTRLANRLGFTKLQDAVQIERALMRVWPPEHWTQMSHFMVFHGRAVCNARAPRCSECTLRDLCPFPTTAKGKSIAR